MTQVCCGPITRLSGNEYRCRCGKDVTDKFRSAGLAGEVIRWTKGGPRFVRDSAGALILVGSELTPNA